MVYENQSKASIASLIGVTFKILAGAFLAAYSIEVFLIPNRILDGGVIGVSILLGELFGEHYRHPAVIILNIPFVFFAFKNIGRSFVIRMIMALVIFVSFAHWMSHIPFNMFSHYHGDLLEIVVIGGLLLGLGVGLILRAGACLDGTEILGIIINKKYGITVGSVVLAANCLIFIAAGFVYGDWHPPVQSLITFFIVIKIMDMVIVGLDEMKSVMIFSECPEDIAEELTGKLGLGLTFLSGRGGYTKEKKEILYLIAERLQLSEIKSLVHAKDPKAFVAIENIHEVATASHLVHISKKPHAAENP